MRDIKIDTNGEILFRKGDFDDAFDDRVIAQDIKLILKNIKNKFWLGSNLEQYIGKPNTEKIKFQIESNVKKEILELDYLKEENVKVIVKLMKNYMTVQAVINSPITNKKFIVSSEIISNSSKVT